MVDCFAVKVDDEATGVSAGNAGAVEGLGNSYIAEIEIAFAADMHRVGRYAFFAASPGDLGCSDDQGAVLTGDIDRIAKMVVMTVRYQHMLATDLIDRGGGNRIATEKRIDDHGIFSFTNITCHNPGQLVGYPILNLSSWQEDVHWYVEQLEEVLIRTAARYGIVAGRKARYTGVWAGNRKLAAIGVSVRRWITGHGFALNVNNDLSLFQQIVPCGIAEFGVTSLRAAGVDVSVAEVAAQIQTEFTALFEAELRVG